MIELIHAYVPGMTERKFGRIVNVSANFIKFLQNAGSLSCRAPRARRRHRILVREVAPHNVSINSVALRLSDTEALRGIVIATPCGA